MEDVKQFPNVWLAYSAYDVNDHMINLKGRDYLPVQARLVAFIRDQRALIAAGLAREPYSVRTELVDLDREAGWAHFKTVARDVLGNESVMYGSESAKDFGDFIEKASTKSLGRALLGLGYGTAFAPEMDEGERVVDAPVDHPSRQEPRQEPQQPNRSQPKPATSDTSWIPERDPDVKKALTALGFAKANEQHDYIASLRTYFATERCVWDKNSVMGHMREQYKQNQVQARRAQVSGPSIVDAEQPTEYDLSKLGTGPGVH